MAKYELEFEDEMSAHAFANQMDLALNDPNTGMSRRTRELLELARDSVRAQIPIPVPDKIGAMVRTDTGVYIRWSYDVHTHNPWIMAQDVSIVLRTDEIGRITEVLSTGVDI